MDDKPRQKLIEIIQTQDWAVGDDARLCEALLNDLCGGAHKRQIKALAGAISAGVVADLTNGSTALPMEMRIAQYARRLYENFGFDEALARWSVETWAKALGVWNELATPPLSHYEGMPAGKLNVSEREALFEIFQQQNGEYPRIDEQQALIRAAEFPRSSSVRIINEAVATWRKRAKAEPVPPVESKLELDLGLETPHSTGRLDVAAWNRAIETVMGLLGNIMPAEEAQKCARMYILGKRENLTTEQEILLVAEYRRAVQRPLHCKGEVDYG